MMPHEAVERQMTTNGFRVIKFLKRGQPPSFLFYVWRCPRTKRYFYFRANGLRIMDLKSYNPATPAGEHGGEEYAFSVQYVREILT